MKRVPDDRSDGPDWAGSFKATGRLGFGWHTEDAERPRSQLEARVWFLQAIQVQARLVLLDLEREPYATVRQLPRVRCDGGTRLGGFHSTISWTQLNQEVERGATDLIPIRDQLVAWQRKHHLDAEWCLNLALAALNDWDHWDRWVPEAPVAPEWVYPGVFDSESIHPAPISEAERRFVFRHPGWDPRQSDLDDGVDRMRKAFEQQLKLYRQKLEYIAKQRNLVPTPIRRNYQHFAWLVRYQVLEDSFNKIAREVGADRSSVTEAIKRLAALLPIDLRDSS